MIKLILAKMKTKIQNWMEDEGGRCRIRLKTLQFKLKNAVSEAEAKDRAEDEIKKIRRFEDVIEN